MDRYLVITRLFSGLRESLLSGRWSPHGVPAFCKLLSYLSRRGVGGDVVLRCMSPSDRKYFPVQTRRTFPGLNFEFHVLPFHMQRLQSDTARALLNYVIDFPFLADKIIRGGYRLVYVDRANLLSGCLALARGLPTVVRFLGIGNMAATQSGFVRSLVAQIQQISIKAPFSLAVSSLDGSPVQQYLDMSLHHDTPRAYLLNGVEASIDFSARTRLANLLKLDRSIPIFLFVGRLSEDKGYLDFIDGFAKAIHSGANSYGIMVCGGSDISTVSSAVDSLGLSNVLKIIQSVPHSDMPLFYCGSDVYVSLNRYGNLSNTVLEAFKSNCAVGMLEPDYSQEIDVFTDDFVPQNSAIRLSRAETSESLSRLIIDLAYNPQKIVNYRENAQKFSNERLWSWEDRLSFEADILNAVAHGADIQSMLARIRMGTVPMRENTSA